MVKIHLSKLFTILILSLTLSSMNCVLPYSYIALLFMSQKSDNKKNVSEGNPAFLTLT